MKNNGFLAFGLKYIIALFFFFALALLLRYCNFRQEHSFDDSSLFIAPDSPEIDSLLAKLSVDEKIAQLIFYQADSAVFPAKEENFKIRKEFSPGGISAETNSLSYYKEIQNALSDNRIKPIILPETKDKLPKFSEFADLPSLDALLAVTTDSLKHNFLNDYIQKIHKYGLNALKIKMPHSSDDSLENEAFFRNLKIFQAVLRKKKMLFSVGTNTFYETDSAGFLKNKKLIKTGLNLIFTQKKELENKYDIFSQTRIKTDYKGLLIYKVAKSQLHSDSLLELLTGGADMLASSRPDDLFAGIKKLIANGKLSDAELNNCLRPVLSAKIWMSEDKNTPKNKLTGKDSTGIDFKLIKRKVYKNSICRVINNKAYLPYKNLLNKSIYLYVIGDSSLPVLETELNRYYSVSTRFISKKNFSDYNFTLKRKHIILALNKLSADSLTRSRIKFLDSLNYLTVINFGKPDIIPEIECEESLIQVFGNSDAEQKFAADAVFGGIACSGILPRRISDKYPYGHGISTLKTRLNYMLPEEAGLSSRKLKKIDSIMLDAVSRRAFPGGQVFVAKNGKIVYEKSFGFHTYSRNKKVRNTDIYDLASVTKVAATTNTAMMAYDKGKIRLDDTLGKFFKDTKIDYSNIKPDTVVHIDTLLFKDISEKQFKKILKIQDTLHISDTSFIAYDTLIFTTTPKRNIFKSVTIRDLLLHKSGISPAMPILPYLLYKKYYYDSIAKVKKAFAEKPIIADSLPLDSLPKPPVFNIKEDLKKRYERYFSNKFIKDSAEIRIAAHFYLQNRYFDTLWRDTKRLRVYSRKVYQYSDVNMILLQQVLDSLNNKGMNEYLYRNLYGKMGLASTGFKAWKFADKNRIIPTEEDKYWRKQVLKGDVHDPSAALLGGVSGNAGLFSTAHELGIIGQMWLNRGTYGGIRYISEKVVELFTAVQEDSHRGLGFDKATPKSITGKGTPPETYGHTGFTGTCIWVDPINEIVYVFLSNRVHPKQNNWRINSLRVRQKVHTAIYESIMD